VDVLLGGRLGCSLVVVLLELAAPYWRRVEEVAEAETPTCQELRLKTVRKGAAGPAERGNTGWGTAAGVVLVETLAVLGEAVLPGQQGWVHLLDV